MVGVDVGSVDVSGCVLGFDFGSADVTERLLGFDVWSDSWNNIPS